MNPKTGTTMEPMDRNLPENQWPGTPQLQAETPQHALFTPDKPTWRPRGLSKWVISRVISTLNGVTLILTLLTTYLLSPLGLQVTPLLTLGSPVTLNNKGTLFPNIRLL